MDTTDVLGAMDIVPFAGAGAVIGATKTMARGAWGVYNYKQTYGRTPRYVTPYGPVSRARRGMVSMAPRDLSRYYR